MSKENDKGNKDIDFHHAIPFGVSPFDEEESYKGIPFGETITIKIPQFGDPAVYNSTCMCSYITKPDGRRVRWGDKCTCCKNTIFIKFPEIKQGN